MTEISDWTFIDRCLAGDATADDYAQLDQWLAADPSRHTLLASFEAARRRVAVGEWEKEREVFTGRVMERVGLGVGSSKPVARRPVAQHGVPRYARWMVWSTGLAAVAVLGVILPRTWSSPVSVQQHVTNAEELATIDLPDGSRIVLAPSSTLRYRYEHDKTEVDLSGQAFFTVHGAASRPFTVTAHGTETRVLGTQFNVRRYADDSVTQVAVVAGKVATGPKRVPAVLGPRMMADVTDSTAAVVEGADVSSAISWTEGRLRFADVPVTRVLDAVSRWYGFSFRLTDTTLARKHVTLGITFGPRDEVLTLLRDVLDVSITVEDSVVVLRPPTRRQPALRQIRTPVREVTTLSEVGK